MAQAAQKEQTDMLRTISPVDDSVLVERPLQTFADVDAMLARAKAAQKTWKLVPMAEKQALMRHVVYVLIESLQPSDDAQQHIAATLLCSYDLQPHNCLPRHHLVDHMPRMLHRTSASYSETPTLAVHSVNQCADRWHYAPTDSTATFGLAQRKRVALPQTHGSLRREQTIVFPKRVAAPGMRLVCVGTPGLASPSDGQVRHLLPCSVTYLCKGANIMTVVMISIYYITFY